LLILRLNGLPELAWSAAAARHLWSFSSRIMGADLVNCISGNTDKFLVATFLGPTPLPLYSLPFPLLHLLFAFSGHLAGVFLPTFARLQDDRERLARAFLATTESFSLAVFPAMTLTILIAPIAVPAVFSEAWIDAVAPLQLLAAMTIPMILLSSMGPLTVAVGRPDWEFRWAVFGGVAGLISFPIGLKWGITGVAASYLIMISVLCIIRFAITQRLIPISARSYLRALVPASASSAVLGVVGLFTEVLLQGVVSGLVLVTLATLVGAASYLIVLRVAWPDDFRRQLDFTRLVVRGHQT